MPHIDEKSSVWMDNRVIDEYLGFFGGVKRIAFLYLSWMENESMDEFLSSWMHNRVYAGIIEYMDECLGFFCASHG